jgi:hypothetical protein
MAHLLPRTADRAFGMQNRVSMHFRPADQHTNFAENHRANVHAVGVDAAFIRSDVAFRRPAETPDFKRFLG